MRYFSVDDVIGRFLVNECGGIARVDDRGRLLTRAAAGHCGAGGGGDARTDAVVARVGQGHFMGDGLRRWSCFLGWVSALDARWSASSLAAHTDHLSTTDDRGNHTICNRMVNHPSVFIVLFTEINLNHHFLLFYSLKSIKMIILYYFIHFNQLQLLVFTVLLIKIDLNNHFSLIYSLKSIWIITFYCFIH